ncbi:MAG: RIP metalloprotease RseP, partial [Lachnospiraceae bacterium]|nr:RIP metalloprotease RseP [Lachnospiraceae bacterium]
RGGTRYSLKLLLFGGSCRMKGMYPGLDTYEEDGDAEVGSGGEGQADEGSFCSAPVGRRMAIIFAGPLFNFILAFICAVIVISVVGYDPAEILYVAEDSAASKAGLLAGDVIENYNGERVVIGRDVATWELFNDYSADSEITMTVKRGDDRHEIAFKPDSERRHMLGMSYDLGEGEAEIGYVRRGSPLEAAGVRAGDVITTVDGTAIENSDGLNAYFSAHPLDGTPVTIGIRRQNRTFEVTVTPQSTDDVRTGFVYNLGRVKTSPTGVLRYSLTEIRYWIVTTVRALGSMFTGRFSVNDISGPVGIADMVGETYEESRADGALMTWMNMINLIILLSANLGVMNLLPIPALDGGRLLFLIIEAIRGKPLDEDLEISVQTVAAVLLIMLMVYVLYHDIARMMGY